MDDAHDSPPFLEKDRPWRGVGNRLPGVTVTKRSGPSYRKIAPAARFGSFGTAFALPKLNAMIIEVCGGRPAMPLKILVYSDYV
jgi:hypothetical protein